MRLKELAKKSKTVVAIYEKVMDVVYPVSTVISPTLNTKLRYKSVFGKAIDLKNPQTLNEKIQWLKLNTYYKNPLIKACADKYKVRDYVTRIGCGELLNDLIAVYENIDDIEWDKLPNSYVLKLNSGCGCNIVVPDSKKLNIAETEKTLKKWWKEKYYLGYSEMQYKDVKPYILIEKYLKPKTGLLPEDYKFYCMNGKAEYVMVCIGRENDKLPKFYFYDRNWNFVPFQEQNNPHINKPAKIDEAFVYADKLSKPFPFVRTDLYLFDDSIYFGELTFTSAGGLDNDITAEGLNRMGKLIDLNYRGSEE